MRFYFQLTSFPPSIPVIQIVSLRGTHHIEAKWPAIPGLGCQPLMVDLNQVVTLNNFNTSTSGSYNTPTNNYIPFVKAAVGVHVYTQAVWADTGNGSAHLSRVSDTIIQPQPSPDFNGKFIYRYAPKTGVIPTSGFLRTSNIPLYRYK